MPILSEAQRQQRRSLCENERTRRLRVLIVTHYFSGKGGGIESVAHALARRFAATCDVRWAAIDNGDGVPADISVQPLRGSNLVERIFWVPFPILSPLSLLRLRHSVRWADVIQIHDSLYTTSQAAFLLAGIHRKPTVLTQHVGEIPYCSWLLSVCARLANEVVGGFVLRKASEVVFISYVVQQHFQRALGRRAARIIYNGVNGKVFYAQAYADRMMMRESRGLSGDEKIALFVGRFVEKKGLHKLRGLAADTPAVTWICIGRGPLDPRTWNAPNVRVFDHMPAAELAKWYNAADLLVLPSVGEGFPLVVQEALACGLPCLVSEEIRMACPEAAHLMISAGPSGEYVGRAFANVLECARAGARERQIRAKQAHALWDWDKSAEAYLRIFHSRCHKQPERSEVLGPSYAKA